MTPFQQDQQHRPASPPPPSSKPKLSPRANGVVLVGVGIGVEALNGAFLANEGQFYPQLVIIGAVLVPLGGWMLITGMAYDKTSPTKPPAWWTAGAVVLTMLGLGVGIFISEWLQR
jgi:hypothetical protein